MGFGVRSEFTPGSTRCELCGLGFVDSPLNLQIPHLQSKLHYLHLRASRKISQEVHRSDRYRAWHIIWRIHDKHSFYDYHNFSVFLSSVKCNHTEDRHKWLADFSPTIWELCNLGHITYPLMPSNLIIVGIEWNNMLCNIGTPMSICREGGYLKVKGKQLCFVYGYNLIDQTTSTGHRLLMADSPEL